MVQTSEKLSELIMCLFSKKCASIIIPWLKMSKGDAVLQNSDEIQCEGYDILQSQKSYL